MNIVEPTFKMDIDFIEMIETVVCQYYDVSPGSLYTNYAGARYVQPRQMCIHFAYHYMDMTFKVLASRYNMHEDTAAKSSRVIENRIVSRNRSIFSKYFYMKERLDNIIKTLYPVTYTDRIFLFMNPLHDKPLTFPEDSRQYKHRTNGK